MSKWKVKLIDGILNILPVLQIGRANMLGRRFRDSKNVDFGEALLKYSDIDLQVINAQVLSKTGAITIVANHPGGADVVATFTGLGRYRPDTVILANRLICIDPIKDMVIPVDTMSKTKVNVNEIDQAYKDGKVIVFYAAGKNSRYNEKGELRDRRWRTTFLEMAKKYNTPIHVMKIEGGNSPLFYKVSKFRERNKWLKNVPLENMFQLREIMEAKGILKVFISNPVLFPNTSEVETKQELRSKADQLYKFIYTMDDNNLDFEEYETSAKSKTGKS
jgi:hypothetical protein